MKKIIVFLIVMIFFAMTVAASYLTFVISPLTSLVGFLWTAILDCVTIFLWLCLAMSVTISMDGDDDE